MAVIVAAQIVAVFLIQQRYHVFDLQIFSPPIRYQLGNEAFPTVFKGVQDVNIGAEIVPPHLLSLPFSPASAPHCRLQPANDQAARGHKNTLPVFRRVLVQMIRCTISFFALSPMISEMPALRQALRRPLMNIGLRCLQSSI